MAAVRSEGVYYFGGGQATSMLEGAISLKTELTCAVSDHSGSAN